jgi:phage terminase large subunit-like protein
MALIDLTEEEREEMLDLIEEQGKLIKERMIDLFFPDTGPLCRELYQKQLEFFNAGKDFKLRLFMAANRVGKTYSAAYEIALHTTGEYPDWWEGKRYDFPNNWWVCGVDSKLVRSELQTLLLGRVGEFGTGMIPAENLDYESLKQAKSAETPVTVFRIKHSSGSFSSIEFKSYESGREAFQSAKVNIWLDEECSLQIFTECLLRTMSTGIGDDLSLITTFTPLKGPTEMVLNFLEGNTLATGRMFDKDSGQPTTKYVVRCGWDDVPHLSDEDKRNMLKLIPPWARDARSKGIPQMGSGIIYSVPLSEILVKRFEIPKHWKRYGGMDVGNKTAAIWFAIDPSTQTHYGYYEYYREGQLPSVHVQGMQGPGLWIPIAIDHAAHGRSQIDGQNLFKIYEDLGLKLTNADKSVEAGLYTCWERLESNKVKIFEDLKHFIEEYQVYMKDEKGNVVKKNDHIMDSFRYAQMTGVDLAMSEMDSKPRHLSKTVSQQYRPQQQIGIRR